MMDQMLLNPNYLNLELVESERLFIGFVFRKFVHNLAIIIK